MTRRWTKKPPRLFVAKESDRYYAQIFGAPAPHQIWAWCVWTGAGARQEGVEFTLKRARAKANGVIDSLSEPSPGGTK